MAAITIDDELRKFADDEAARRGLSGADALIERLLLDVKAANGSEAKHKSSRAEVAEAIAELRRLRVGNRLDGLTIRQLIEEGRRF